MEPSFARRLRPALLALGLGLAPLAAQAEVVSRWIQLGPGEQGQSPLAGPPSIWARAITTDGACPALKLDGRPAAVQMQIRFANTPGFGVTQCEAVVPPGHRTALIGDVELRLPVQRPRRILVLADTGCRMNGAAQQNCHDPVAFPTQAVMDAAAALEPDLVIHIGDFFYRDTGCGGAFPGRDDPASPAYEPFGDNWASWKGDFFDPAHKLLATAPWVMVRGNHESCGRGAHGWYSLLDPKPYAQAAVDCPAGSFFTGTSKAWDGSGTPYGYDFNPSYVVPLGETSLLVHDSSFAVDASVDPVMAARYDRDLAAAIAAIGRGDAVLTTHKPTFALIAGAPTNGGNFTEQFVFSGGVAPTSPFAGGVPYSLGLFLSGHVHQLEYVNLMDFARFAPQLIVGVGGSQLDAPTTPGQPVTSYANQPFTLHNIVDGTTETPVEKAYSRAEFGFAVLEPEPRGFRVQAYTLAEGRKGRCNITLGTRRGIACNF